MNPSRWTRWIPFCLVALCAASCLPNGGLAETLRLMILMGVLTISVGVAVLSSDLIRGSRICDSDLWAETGVGIFLASSTWWWISDLLKAA